MNETPSLSRVLWDSAAEPQCGLTLNDVLYRIRVDDAGDGLLFDPLTIADVLEGGEVVRLDALVTQAGKLLPKMQALLRIMELASPGEVKPLAVQISEPIRRYGGVHVAALFEMSDGQTVTVWFHNPDSTPARLTPADDLVSWKWVLNKKDITIVVAPESGNDLNTREAARRVMRLVQKNSAAFQRANAKRAERMAEIQGLRDTLGEKQAELAGLHRAIEVAMVEKADRDSARDRGAWVDQIVSPETMQMYGKQEGVSVTSMLVKPYAGGEAVYQATLQHGSSLATLKWNDESKAYDLTANDSLLASGGVLAVMGKLKSYVDPSVASMAAGALTPGYAEWEDALITLVEQRMEADRGDAQGIVEAKDMGDRGILLRLHAEGLDAETAYQRLFGDDAPAGGEQDTPPAGPSRAVLLQREAESQPWGIGSPNFYGVIPDGHELPDNFMPTDNRQMAMEMGELAKEHGEAIAVQIKPDQDKPFRVLLVMYPDGRGVGSQWAETAAEAYVMVKDAPRITQEQEPQQPPAESAEAVFLREVAAGAHDAIALEELLTKIEASMVALQESGQLTEAAEAAANDALKRWAALEEKAAVA